jgi:hypothetical protein
MRKLKIPWQTFRVHPTRQSGKARYTGDKPR